MGENSKIEWCDHTFNPWQGCSKVSAGCTNCYAEERNNRFKTVEWGPGGTRKKTSDSNWKKPLAWNKQAEAEGVRKRVFCASLADVFENRQELVEWRYELFELIEQTPHLDWLLLTKRPEYVLDMMPARWHQRAIPDNVWIGTSVENQEQADKRIPELLKVPAKVRFLSCEPLLGPVDLERFIQPILPISVESAPPTWAEWNSRELWPHWVPDKWRRNIEDFHSEEWSRDPKRWLQSTLRNGCPPFGSEMVCNDCIGKKGVSITGQFVHTWNNMCILVDSLGEAHVTSTSRHHLFDPGPSAGSYQKINWVICGGESGPHARPMEPQWVLDIQSQCTAAGVPFFFKQGSQANWKNYKDFENMPVGLRVREVPNVG